MRRAFFVALLAVAALQVASCGGGSSIQQPTPPPTPAAITATSGTPQSTVVNTAFAAPLVATVTDSQSRPVSGAVVTFSAPSLGPTGTFAGGAITATTNAKGMATSPTFTASATLGSYVVTATVVDVVAPANFILTNTVGPPAQVVPKSGSGQSAATSTAFITAFTVEVVDNSGDPLSGVLVTFNVPSAGPSITFAGGVSTATTDSTGMATSLPFSANATSGAFTVTATVTGASTGNFNLKNVTPGPSSNYCFYLSGLESARFFTNSYALAGSVIIDSNGYVLAGEQDYKDDWKAASPQPSGDTISGGALTVSGTTGQGTLTLITNDPILGANGIETLGVQFINSKHAVVIQLDGSATSIGSMDLQTLPSTLNGGFAFTLLGTDPNDFATAAGGVFSISGSNLTNGTYDFDDTQNGTGGGTVATGAPFAGTISGSDSFGRGTITIAGAKLPTTINYYVVGPEVMRLVVVGPGLSSGIGSAFGQGAGATFGNASLGNSIFGVESNSNVESYLYAAAGMITTNPGTGTFQGVADDDEEGAMALRSPISGTYSIAGNGYGSLTISPGTLGNVSVLGIYATDPNLNLVDPNNTTSGLGGALLADLDEFLNGTGVLLPQTNTSTGSFAGNYVFGARQFSQIGQAGWEVDFLGQGTFSTEALTGIGLASDPSSFFFGASATDSNVSFSGAASPDAAYPGRYTFSGNGLTLAVSGFGTYNYPTVIVYQANSEQLLWMNENLFTLFLGPLELQAALAGIPGAK